MEGGRVLWLKTVCSYAVNVKLYVNNCQHVDFDVLNGRQVAAPLTWLVEVVVTGGARQRRRSVNGGSGAVDSARYSASEDNDVPIFIEIDRQ
jgi:hypothetical protein